MDNKIWQKQSTSWTFQLSLLSLLQLFSDIEIEMNVLICVEMTDILWL